MKSIVKFSILAGSAKVTDIAKLLSNFRIKGNFSIFINDFNQKTSMFSSNIRISTRFEINDKDVKFKILSPFTIDLIKEELSKNNKDKLTDDDLLKIAKLKQKFVNTLDIDKIVKTIKSTYVNSILYKE